MYLRADLYSWSFVSSFRKEYLVDVMFVTDRKKLMELTELALTVAEE